MADAKPTAKQTAASRTTDTPADAEVKSVNTTGPDPLVTPANPEGKDDVSTGQVGDPEVIHAQEHVLGDDPRRTLAQRKGGHHDSLSGRPVDAEGWFQDNDGDRSEGPIPGHRIVPNDWAHERPKLDDPALRRGNKAAQ